MLFAAQIFYIVIKSIYVNLYKAQKKQSIYFIKLTAIIVVGFVFNVICYNLYKVKESFAVGTLLSAVCRICEIFPGRERWKAAIAEIFEKTERRTDQRNRGEEKGIRSLKGRIPAFENCIG